MKLRELKPGMAIRCSNEEEKSILLKELAKQGYLWVGKAYPTCEEFYTGNTIHIYEPSELYKYKHITWSDKEGNINFSELIIPELSTEEVLKIRNDLPFDYVREYLGLCYGRSLDEMLRMAKPAQIIDMCIKWKAEHIETKIERLTVGDIVFCKGKKINVAIVKVYNENGVQIYKGLGEDGQAYGFMEHEVNKSITRTGRKIDISSILAEIGKEIKHE